MFIGRNIRGISGYFVKDDIKVDIYWDDMIDYVWELKSTDENAQKKVYEWAVTVYEEYRKEGISEQ